MATQTEQAQNLVALMTKREILVERRRANEVALMEAEEQRRSAFFSDNPTANQAKADAQIFALRLNAENFETAIAELDRAVRISTAQMGRHW